MTKQAFDFMIPPTWKPETSWLVLWLSPFGVTLDSTSSKESSRAGCRLWHCSVSVATRVALFIVMPEVAWAISLPDRPGAEGWSQAEP